MPSIKFCRENAGAVTCDDAKCTHCGWNSEEADRRKEFIRKNGLCRSKDIYGNTYFVFRINKETGKYAMPTQCDKKAWRECKESFDKDKIIEEIHDYNVEHRNEK